MKRVLLVFVGIFVLVMPSFVFADTAPTGTVVKGTVLEKASRSPVRASILAYKQNASGGWDFTGSEQTDAGGNFSFNYLGEGTFYLECEAGTDCNPQRNYCASKYLPQFYNNVPVYKPANRTTVTLQDGDVRQLDTILVKTRPFYFDTVSNACTRANSNGVVKIAARVVNTTGSDRWVMFFGVMDSPRRTDRSSHYGQAASYPFVNWNWRLLKPGVNTLTFTHRLVNTSLKGRYDYWIVGGDSAQMPITPYLDGCFTFGDAQ